MYALFDVLPIAIARPWGKNENSLKAASSFLSFFFPFFPEEEQGGTQKHNGDPELRNRMQSGGNRERRVEKLQCRSCLMGSTYRRHAVVVRSLRARL